MAKTYRTIRFITTTETLEVDVRTDNEQVTRDEISSIFTSYSGKRYKQITGYNYRWEYRFRYADEELFQFFQDGYDAQGITFERELDDGTFESYSAFLEIPEYQEDTVGTDGKVYRDFRVRVLSA